MTHLRLRTYRNNRVIEREAKTRMISRIVEAKEVMRNGTKWNTHKKEDAAMVKASRRPSSIRFKIRRHRAIAEILRKIGGLGSNLFKVEGLEPGSLCALNLT